MRRPRCQAVKLRTAVSNILFQLLSFNKRSDKMHNSYDYYFISCVNWEAQQEAKCTSLSHQIHLHPTAT